jgi:hypothetical protein
MTDEEIEVAKLANAGKVEDHSDRFILSRMRPLSLLHPYLNDVAQLQS